MNYSEWTGEKYIGYYKSNDKSFTERIQGNNKKEIESSIKSYLEAWGGTFRIVRAFRGYGQEVSEELVKKGEVVTPHGYTSDSDVSHSQVDRKDRFYVGDAETDPDGMYKVYDSAWHNDTGFVHAFDLKADADSYAKALNQAI